jgi:hypothetical protein
MKREGKGKAWKRVGSVTPENTVSVVAHPSGEVSSKVATPVGMVSPCSPASRQGGNWSRKVLR